MKNISFVLLVLVPFMIFHSCHKENGRHKYLLTLDFDDYSDDAIFEYYVFEKVKNYKQSWAPDRKDLYANKGGMVLANEGSLPLIFKLYEGGVKRGMWTSSNYFEFDDDNFPVNTIPINSSNKFIGEMNMSLSYRRDGREIIAINSSSSICSFTFVWQNHADFGYTDSIIHGKCSLNRIE